MAQNKYAKRAGPDGVTFQNDVKQRLSMLDAVTFQGGRDLERTNRHPFSRFVPLGTRHR